MNINKLEMTFILSALLEKLNDSEIEDNISLEDLEKISNIAEEGLNTLTIKQIKEVIPNVIKALTEQILNYEKSAN